MSGQQYSDIDGDKVKVNDGSAYSVFDSGSSLNIITRNLLNQLKIRKPTLCDIPMQISMLNGDKIVSREKVLLNISNNGVSVSYYYWVIDKGLVNLIIGNNLLKLIRVKKFSIECTIKTNSPKIISMNRPYKPMK